MGVRGFRMPRVELDETIRLFERGVRLPELVVGVDEIELALRGVAPERKAGAELPVVVYGGLEVAVVECLARLTVQSLLRPGSGGIDEIPASRAGHEHEREDDGQARMSLHGR